MLQPENRDLRERCSLLAQPNMLRDMEKTMGQNKQTRRELDALQSTHARIDDQIKTLDKIRAAKGQKQSKARLVTKTLSVTVIRSLHCQLHGQK